MSRRKSPHQERVEAFMAKANQAVPDRPTMPDSETRKFRAKIILEETLETIEALGMKVVSRGLAEFVIEESSQPPDLNEIIDGCADIHVVTTGTLSACGVADEALMVEVDNNNLAKFGPGSYRREDGKWMKPPDHKPPDIERIVKEQTP
jgi:predicted HAD superfamily Cof-like phosphohydrolase